MPIGVVRFGGDSFKNKGHLHAFVEELKKDTQKWIVVVSAIPQIFEILHTGIRGLVNHSLDYKTLIIRIQKEISLTGIVPEKESRIQKEISRLEALLNGIQFTGDYSDALRDTVISFSEKISAQVLACVLDANRLDPAVFYPEEFDFLVTEEFGNATVLTNENCQIKDFHFQQLNLVPGSYGISSGKKIVRLGDRASDYTASALTRLLGAKNLELWEPGPSFRTADNTIVPDSAVISRLTYEEASELSYFSHSSLHPRIVEPLIREHIPIKIFRFSTSGKELETVINSESFVSNSVVKSVVSDDEIAILKLNGPGVGFKPGILAGITGSFHQAGINIRSVITSQVSINIILEKKDAEKAKHICRDLALTSVSELIIQDRVSLIAVVGHGMQCHHGVSAKLFKAVADSKINVLLSGSGASDLVSYLIIDQVNKEKAIREIHKMFF